MQNCRLLLWCSLCVSALYRDYMLPHCANFVATGDVIQTSPVINLCAKAGSFAMTFVGGPSILTGAVLDAFDKRKVKATFLPVVTYLNEVTIVANLQRAASEGHLVGLELEQSLNASSLGLGGSNYTSILAAIDERAAIIQHFTGYKPTHLSIPDYSSWPLPALDAVTAHGYSITTYNLDSYDYRDANVLQNFESVLNTLSPNTRGAFISSQHDNVAASVNQTGAIIDFIIGKGYSLITLDVCVGGPSPLSQKGGSDMPVHSMNGSGVGQSAGSSDLSASSAQQTSYHSIGAAIVGASILCAMFV